MRPLSLLLLALLALPARAADPADPVVATVNGAPITASAFAAAASRKPPADGKALSEAERQEVLDRLIEEELMYQAALQRGLDKDPKVKKVMVNLWLKDRYDVVKNSDFNDADLQAYYDTHKDEFVVPEKVQVRMITIRVSDSRGDAEARELAEDLRQRAASNPEGFSELATASSEDPYRRRGGDLGFIPRSGKPGLDPKVVEVAFALPTNGVSEVFKVADGYAIVSVPNRREAVERTFQQMKGTVLRKVKNDRMKAIYDQSVAELKKGAKVKVENKTLKTVEVKAAPHLGFGGVQDGATTPTIDPAESMDPTLGTGCDEEQ